MAYAYSDDRDVNQLIITVANQKGGVGKTTIADALADALERSGHSVAFISIDPQSGARHRDKEMAGDEEFLITDTRGSTDDRNRGSMSLSSLIVIPMEPGELAMNASEVTYKMAREVAPKAPIILVINKCTKYKATKRCIQEVRKSALAGADAILLVPQRAAFVNASYAGRSIFDEDRKAAEPIMTLAGMCVAWREDSSDRSIFRKMAAQSNWHVDVDEKSQA